MAVFLLIGSGLTGAMCLVLSFLGFLGKDIILDDTYIKASKEEQEKMDKKAYRLQGAGIFLFLGLVSLCSLLRIVTGNAWFAYLGISLGAIGVTFALISRYVIRNRMPIFDKKAKGWKGVKEFRRTVIFGMVLMLLPAIYFRPDYEALQIHEIQVQSVHRTSGGRYQSASYHIKTVDGERYEVRGAFDSEDLKALDPSVSVRVKYYRGLVNIRLTKVIKEMTCGEETIVSYNGDSQMDWQLFMTVLGALFVSCGFIPLRLPKRMRRNRRKK